MFWEWSDKIIALLFLLLIGFLFSLVIIQYKSLTLAVLKRNEWECTEYLTSLQPVFTGKVITPMVVNECVRYEIK